MGIKEDQSISSESPDSWLRLINENPFKKMDHVVETFLRLNTIRISDKDRQVIKDRLSHMWRNYQKPEDVELRISADSDRDLQTLMIVREFMEVQMEILEHKYFSTLNSLDFPNRNGLLDGHAERTESWVKLMCALDAYIHVHIRLLHLNEEEEMPKKFYLVWSGTEFRLYA